MSEKCPQKWPQVGDERHVKFIPHGDGGYRKVPMEARLEVRESSRRLGPDL